MNEKWLNGIIWRFVEEKKLRSIRGIVWLKYPKFDMGWFNSEFHFLRMPIGITKITSIDNYATVNFNEFMLIFSKLCFMYLYFSYKIGGIFFTIKFPNHPKRISGCDFSPGVKFGRRLFGITENIFLKLLQTKIKCKSIITIFPFGCFRVIDMWWVYFKIVHVYIGVGL